MSSTTVIVCVPFILPEDKPFPSSSNISSAPEITILEPLLKPWLACVTFITPDPCCVANGSSSSSTNKSSFNVTVICVPEVKAVTVASLP